MWFMPSFFVQESARVSDSDSDAEFTVVARGLPPDVFGRFFFERSFFRYLRRAFWLQMIHYLALLVFLIRDSIRVTGTGNGKQF